MNTPAPVELPSGVHHGTPEGHLAGCKGERANCPALLEHGMSCTYAYVRSTTTPDRYYKAKARNPEPREIARTLGFKPTTRAAALAAVFEADATLRTRTPAPPRERTATMPEPEPTPTPPVVVEEPVVEEPAVEEPAPSNAEIRRWAKTAGLTVPARGPIPKPVAIAYDDAHTPSPAAEAGPTDRSPSTLTLADFTRGLSKSATRERGGEIRAWIRAHGHPGLADRGTIAPSALYGYLLAHPGATDPAQPLAERSQDPRDTTPAPADEVAAATPTETPAEGEDMGHPGHAEVQPTIGARAWLRYEDGIGVVRLMMVDDDGRALKVRVSWLPDRRDEDGWATYLNQISPWIDATEFYFDAFPAGSSTPVELAKLNSDVHHVEATEELIDQIRDRIDMPKPPGRTITDAPGPRPEWAGGAISNEVTAALAERDQALTECERARSLAIALDHAHDAAIARAETAEHALELALQAWATATTRLDDAERVRVALVERLTQLESLHRRVKRAAAGWMLRAQRTEATLEKIYAAAQRGPGSAIAAILGADGTPGVRITTAPQPRQPWWRRNAR